MYGTNAYSMGRAERLFLAVMDCAKSRDHSAIGILEMTPPPPGDEDLSASYVVHGLKEVPLNVDYVTQTGYFQAAAKAAVQAGAKSSRSVVHMVIDRSGPGEAIADMALAQGVAASRLIRFRWFASGKAHAEPVKGKDWAFSAAKGSCYNALARVIRQKKIKFRPGSYRDALIEQCEHLVTKVMGSGYEKIEVPDGSGVHDDLLDDLAMGVAWGDHVCAAILKRRGVTGGAVSTGPTRANPWPKMGHQPSTGPGPQHYMPEGYRPGETPTTRAIRERRERLATDPLS